MKTRLTFHRLPPSVNAIWRHAKGGNTYRTEAYMTWLRGEWWSLNRQAANQPRWSSPVYLTVAMRRPKRRRDIDNCLKPLGDILQLHKIIADDSLIHGWNVFWSDCLPDDVDVELSITAADPFGLESMQ